MQLLWLLPSALLGLGFALVTGHWYWGLASLAGLALVYLGQRRRERYSRLDWGGSIEFSPLGVAVSGVPLPARGLFFAQEWNLRLLERLAEGTGFLPERDAVTLAVEGAANSGDEIPLLLGLDPGGAGPRVLDLRRHGPHALLIGPSGSGKSEALGVMVSALIASGRVRLALLDFKGGAGLERFAERGSILGFASNLTAEPLSDLVTLLECELDRREAQHGQAHEALLVVVDEFGAALGHDRALARLLERIVFKGRSLGVQLMATNQSLIGIPRALLINIRVRIAIARVDPIELTQLQDGRGATAASLPTAPPGWQALTAMVDGHAQTALFPLGFRAELGALGAKQVRWQAPRAPSSAPERPGR